MLGEMRKYVRFGLEALSAQGSDDVPGAMKARARGVAEQLSALAAGFLEWSAEARASLLQELREVVARQVEDMGVATKKDLDVLRARLDRLEAKVGDRAKSGRATTAKRGQAGSAKSGKGSSSSRSRRSTAGSSSSKKAVSGRRRASRGRE